MLSIIERSKSNSAQRQNWTGPSFISLLERGIQSPNIVVLVKIAGVLNVPAADLIARMESRMRESN